MIRRGLVGFSLTLLVTAGTACAPRPDSPSGGDSAASRPEYAIAIHGGAGVIDRSRYAHLEQPYVDSLQRALEAGRSMLADGQNSLDTVQHVVMLLEDDPLFNAGKGAVFNADGDHELDASIMDGSTLAGGAVAGVRGVKNPIALARLVMERTPHVLLAGPGAERFADEQGMERVASEYFDTERRREQWREHMQEESHGTVGAVALDRFGNLAAATSTGGLTGKLYGRVGDSPVIGAGTYANNASCAVSGTGKGEEFIRHSVAFHIASLMEVGGLDLRTAARRVIHEVLEPGHGGAIAVDHEGNIALEFNTGGMFRGAADSTGRFEVAIWDE